jgi:hypothetical protein
MEYLLLLGMIRKSNENWHVRFICAVTTPSPGYVSNDNYFKQGSDQWNCVEDCFTRLDFFIGDDVLKHEFES